MGMTTEEITHPLDRESNSLIFDQLVNETITNSRIMKRYLRKDNTDFWGDLSISSIKKLSTDDEILLICIVIDITGSIAAENLINQKNIELEKLINERNRFISTLAHDLKSPFNSMLGFSDLMVENMHIYDRSKIENHINIINYTIHQTYNLFNDILAWAKIQSGRLSFNPITFDLNQTCSETIKSLRLNAIQKKINIRLSIEKNIFVYADQTMIKSILRNLISNSLKFSNTGGKVSVKVYRSGLLNKNTP